MFVKIGTFPENNGGSVNVDADGVLTCKSLTFKLVTKTTSGANTCYHETVDGVKIYLIAKSSTVTLPAKEPIYKLPGYGKIRHTRLYSYWEFPDADFRWGSFDSITDDERLISWSNVVHEDLTNSQTYSCNSHSSLSANTDWAYQVQGTDFMTTTEIDNLKLTVINSKLTNIETILSSNLNDDGSSSDKFFDQLDVALGVGTGLGTAALIAMIIKLSKDVRKIRTKLTHDNSSHGS